MPPKEIMQNCGGYSLNRGKSYSKLFIRPCEGGDWKEINGVAKASISIVEELPPPESINATGEITITFKPMFYNRKLHRQMLKLMGFKVAKPRKTTYKTLRHDCAKRNGRRYMGYGKADN
jgi:hypothetical protein